MQKKRVHICLRLNKMHYISLTEFRSMNWLPTKERVHQCISAITFKYVNNSCSFYLNEIFEFSPHRRIDAGNSFVRLKHPFHKTERCETIYPLKNE